MNFGALFGVGDLLQLWRQICNSDHTRSSVALSKPTENPYVGSLVVHLLDYLVPVPLKYKISAKV